MSTKMDEEDWAYTLTVFRAPAFPGEDGRGNDDRRFLEALHFFTVENRFDGAPCRNALVPGTAYGNASTD